MTDLEFCPLTPEAKNFKFENGTPVFDLISGFGGYVIGRADYITGCNQYLLQPHTGENDGSKKPDALWFDENRLQRQSGDILDVKLPPFEKPGADIPAPVK